MRNEILKLVRQYGENKYKKTEFVPGETFVPVNGKVMSSLDLEYLVEASLDGWLTTGRFNSEFQTRMSNFLKIKHVLTVNSGSSANLVAFSTLTSPKLGKKSIKPGDEVITVAAGFPTTVNPIIQKQAIPVFLDIDPYTYNINTTYLEQALSERTKAVMIAHTLGNPFDCSSVKKFCDKHDLWLIEDCCDALGAKSNGKMVGSFGDIATLSFYPAHHITMGEGGAVFTNNEQLKTISESFRDWGRDCYCEPGKDNTCGKRYDQQLGNLPYGYDHKFTYGHIGYNLKISDMQAAVGCAQLHKLDDFIIKRKYNFEYLAERLGKYTDYFTIAHASANSDPSWFGFPITLKESTSYNRRDLLKFLEKCKIGSRLLFGGNLVRQPYMKDVKFRVASDLDVTDNVMKNTFWIGCYHGLDKYHLDYIVQSIESFFGLDL